MSLITYEQRDDGSLWVILRRADAGPELFGGKDGDILMSIPREAYVDVEHAKLIIDKINDDAEDDKPCPHTNRYKGHGICRDCGAI